MKKWLLSIITVIMVLVPVSAFAEDTNSADSKVDIDTLRNHVQTFNFALVENNGDDTGSSVLVEDDISNLAGGDLSGYGTITCKDSAVALQMYCDYSVTLNKTGEAIQQMFLIFDVYAGAKLVGTKDEYREDLGGNQKTMKGQIEFTPGNGTFYVQKYGVVVGRKAQYNLLPIKSAEVTVK
ncbi:hypothetical protein A8L34_16760 [Bacillus sp. FJAT-27264]|uniref:hypothetical protein n=1 Tax=Paenibacillus sp. (strain DSM 101736 / FJAT-27264) TaxID=1850362 RepID=UPI000807B663|nr:hypothetical protein [Bacillus sp. FJAT-27264]OBZ11966.1 hypothetical protein A8L34_16760 [Bacillus sp. FJAT-27264]